MHPHRLSYIFFAMFTRILKKIRRWILYLRFEELIAAIFLGPMTIVTFKAHGYFSAQGAVPKHIQGDLIRVFAVFGLIILYIAFRKWNPEGKVYRFIREAAPFGLAIAIYTNLHDTIHFINPNDIHWTLVKIDEWMFGVQPVLWVQRFYHPILTEFFSFSYMNYFIIPPVIAFTLYFRGRYRDYRETMLGVILSYYFGYFLYIAFPAAPPRLVLADQFTRDFYGFFFDNIQHEVIITAASNRAAFPSLHCATTFLALVYAFKYARTMFWAFLPIAVGLILGTVYLRHHYVIDIIAGIALAIFVYFIAPVIDRWWCKKRIREDVSDISCWER